MTSPRTATDFREQLRWRAARLEELQGVLPDGRPVVATVKVDGELEVWDADAGAGTATLHNRNERQRHVPSIQSALAAALRAAGYQRARGAGELYTVDTQGRPQPFEATISQVKTRTAPTTPVTEQSQLRLAVFDLFALDGQDLWTTMTYADRFALLWSIFGDSPLVRPVAGQAVQGETDPIRALWQRHVDGEGFEGLVVRTNGALKVKPVHTVDVVVIGIQPGRGKHHGRMGALATALRDAEGRFLEAGKVGTGFTDAERMWWIEHAPPLTPPTRRQLETGAVLPVAPVHVLEVAAERFIRQPVPTWLWQAQRRVWVPLHRHPGAIMQKPRAVRRRDDKTIAPHDVRVTQIPGWPVEAVYRRPIPTPAQNGKAFAALLVEVRPLLERWASKLRVPAGDFEDVYQDTVVKALTAWRRLETTGGPPGPGQPTPGRPIGPWIFGIFQRAWQDLVRKRQRQAAKLAAVEQRGRAMRERAARRRPNPRRPKAKVR